MEQTFFNYNFKPNFQIENFFVGESNFHAFNFLIKKNTNNNNFFLNGPSKSGKTHLSIIWKNKFDAILYENNIDLIINKKKNILIDDLFQNIDEEKIFHIINHCNLYNLKILINSRLPIFDYNFKIIDLSSRLKIFQQIQIDLPNDEMLINLIMKLFFDKQIIVKNHEIFNYIIRRVDRSYEKIFILVDKIDKLLFKKNKQLTIPLIKELI